VSASPPETVRPTTTVCATVPTPGRVPRHHARPTSVTPTSAFATAKSHPWDRDRPVTKVE
jgi:hypothetical protein